MWQVTGKLQNYQITAEIYNNYSCACLHEIELSQKCVQLHGIMHMASIYELSNDWTRFEESCVIIITIILCITLQSMVKKGFRAYENKIPTWQNAF